MREWAFYVIIGRITLVWMSVANFVPIHWVDMKVDYKCSEQNIARSSSW